MYIAYDETQQALRRELRSYYDGLLTPEVRAELARTHQVGECMREVVRRMGADGWLGIGWPKEYGGQGRSHIEQFIFFDESMRAGAPVPMLTINTVGPQIMAHGTDAQKDFFLPKILKGDLHFCIGYSEAQAGTDLAALPTRAERDGNEWVINGQKLWTSLASDSDYCWLAVRTDPEGPNHSGLSIMIVDMKNTPGIRIDPLDLLSSHDINAVFFDDVRIPVENVIGPVDGGWTVVRGLLAHERNAMGNASPLSSGRWLTPTETGRSDLMELAMTSGQSANPEIRQLVAEDYALRYVQDETTRRVGTGMASGHLPPTAGALLRLMGARAGVRRSDMALTIAGSSAAAWHTGDPAGQMGSRYVGRQAVEMGGGTTEMQRNLISERLLEMPREVAADRGVPFNEVRHNTMPGRGNKG